MTSPTPSPTHSVRDDSSTESQVQTPRAATPPHPVGEGNHKGETVVSSYPVKEELESVPQSPTESQAQWTVHWYLPSLMVSQYLLAAAFALGHHFYYRSFNTTIVNSQWPLQVGVALAFITQRCFVGAALVAYKQCAWHTLNRKSLKLSTIDRVFEASRDPTQALSREFITATPGQLLFAAVCWLLPLAAIASPSALVVMPTTTVSSEICPHVASLNFSRENDYTDIYDKGTRETTIVYWGYYEGTRRLVYSQPSYDFSRLAGMTLPSNAGPPSPPFDPCSGANCTMTISFDGPAQRCQEMPDFDPATTTQRLDRLPPSGNEIYNCNNINSNSTSYKNELEINSGVPAEWIIKDGPMYTKNWGTFNKTYPMWFGYVSNTTRPWTGDNSTLWPWELERKVLKCELHHARYTIDLSFEGGQQTVVDKQVELKRPLLVEGEVMTPDNTTYKEFATYHAIGVIFHKYFSGVILQDNSSTNPKPVASITATNLVHRFTSLPVDNFGPAIENRFTHLVLSIMADQRFNPVVNVSAPCLVSRYAQRWGYEPFWLAISYGAGSAVALIAVAAGAYTFRSNRYGVDTAMFSTMVAVTRNRELDELMEGCSLGRAPLPQRVLRKRLRFGDITGLDRAHRDGEAEGKPSRRRAAFGSETGVGPTMVGEKYD